MGFVNSMNESSIYGTDIVANKAYCVEDAMLVAQESEQAWQGVFEAVAGLDYINARVKYGAVTESAVEVVTESAVGDILKRVKDAIVKFGEKIKGIIMNLIHKFQALFTSDGKKLVKDHEKAVREKLNKQLMNKFKYKYGKFTEPDAAVIDILAVTELDKNLKRDINNMNTYDQADTDDHNSYNNALSDNFTEKKSYKLRTSDEVRDLKEAFLSKVAGTSTDSKSFRKDIVDNFIDDPEEEEGFDNTIFATVTNTLMGHKKLMDGLSKSEKSLQKNIKDQTKKVEEVQKRMNKKSSEKDYDKVNKATAAHAARAMQLLNAESEVVSTAFAGIADVYKKNYKQCRAIWVKAVGYNGKTNTDEAATVLEAAIAETSNYDVDQYFI